MEFIGDPASDEVNLSSCKDISEGQEVIEHVNFTTTTSIIKEQEETVDPFPPESFLRLPIDVGPN